MSGGTDDVRWESAGGKRTRGRSRTGSRSRSLRDISAVAERRGKSCRDLNPTVISAVVRNAADLAAVLSGRARETEFERVVGREARNGLRNRINQRVDIEDVRCENT